MSICNWHPKGRASLHIPSQHYILLFWEKNDETGTAGCNSRRQEFLTQVVLSHLLFQRKLWLMNNVWQERNSVQNKKTEPWAEQHKQCLNFLLWVENIFTGFEGLFEFLLKSVGKVIWHSLGKGPRVCVHGSLRVKTLNFRQRVSISVYWKLILHGQ